MINTFRSPRVFAMKIPARIARQQISYQLDLEMSFVDQQDIFDTIQPVLTGVFEEFGGGRKVDQTWEQISYRDAALWYGSDKPDLRNPIKIASCF